MRPSSRVALALSATAVLALFTGCGSTLYDAAGVPQLVLQCTNPQVPVACAAGCVAESDAACGKSCLDCVGDAAASADPNAANACDRTSASLVDHACDFTCPAGMQKDLVNKRCACTAATQVRCVGSNACVDQGPALCGDACEDCTATPPPAHASRICNDAARQCDFACDATFKKNPLGDACVCQNAGEVVCGAGGTACIPQTVSVCGASCTSCTALTLDAATGAVSPTCAGDGKGVDATTPCDFTCSDPALPTKNFDSATKRGFCSAPVCGAGTHQCTVADPTCYNDADAGHCGTLAAGCPPCSAPAGATPTCVNDACSFTCPAGTLKSNDACVQVSKLPGSVAVGGDHTCAITALGDLMCWGANAGGQLRLVPGADQLTPVAVGLADVQYVAAAGDRTCAVVAGLPGGNVRCWGGGSAALVDPGVTGATAVAVGTAHACAIVAGGGVVCWGANDKGQVGNGGPLAPSVVIPTPVKTTGGVNLAGITKLSSSADHTCALAGVAGAVWCWGANDNRQVLSPASAAVSNATLVVASQATDVAAGGKHSCAAAPVKNDPINKSGDSRCWGDDTFAQLGDKQAIPAPGFADQLDHLADLVAAGRNHTCNTRSADVNPALLCAGADDLWQAGGPPPPAAQLPFTIKGPDLGFLTQITVLVSGGDHSCVVTVTGELKCWGANTHGQLGTGTTANSAAPISPAPQ